jgi:hypothetical protein
VVAKVFGKADWKEYMEAKHMNIYSNKYTIKKERNKSSGICRNRYVIEVLGKEGARTDIWVARRL